MEPKLAIEYKERVFPALKDKLGVSNPHQVPKIEKVIGSLSLAA